MPLFHVKDATRAKKRVREARRVSVIGLKLKQKLRDVAIPYHLSTPHTQPPQFALSQAAARSRTVNLILPLGSTPPPPLIITTISNSTSAQIACTNWPDAEQTTEHLATFAFAPASFG
jgi:hypothetical protein